MVASAHGACIGGAILTAFALGLGASNFHIGLIAGSATLAHLGLIAGARGSLRLRSRKRIVVPAAFASRAIWALLAAVPFLPVRPDTRIWGFLGILLVAQTLYQASVSPWNDWIADLVPESIRGRYFGQRNALCGAVGMLSALAAGRSFDWLKSRASSGEEMRVFIPFFLAAALLAFVSAGVTLRLWDPPLAADRRPPTRGWLLRPLHHAPFRTLIRFHMLWACACSIAGPFFGAHMLRNLHMPMSAIAWYGVLAGSVGLLTHPLWGRIVDRFGNRPVLVCNLIAVVFLPLFWFFATPSCWMPIWIDALLTGLCWPGLNLALFNLVLGTAPAEERQGFLATQGVLIGIAHFAAATAGGLLAQAWVGFTWPVGPVTLVNYHLLFGLSALARLALLPLAIGLHEPRAVPVRALISGMVEARYRLGDMILAGMENTVAIIRRRNRDDP
jgi:MFS family permease